MAQLGRSDAEEARRIELALQAQVANIFKSLVATDTQSGRCLSLGMHTISVFFRNPSFCLSPTSLPLCMAPHPLKARPHAAITATSGFVFVVWWMVES